MKKSELRQMIREEMAFLKENKVKIKKKGDVIVMDTGLPRKYSIYSGEILKVLDVKKRNNQIFYVVDDPWGEYERDEVPHNLVVK